MRSFDTKWFFPRGILNKVLYGHTPLWKGPTPYPFKNHFRRQKYPFRLSSIDKWYPFCDNTASHTFKRLLNRHFNLYQVPRRYKRNWIYNESSSTCKWNSTQGVKITIFNTFHIPSLEICILFLYDSIYSQTPLYWLLIITDSLLCPWRKKTTSNLI